MFVAAGKYPIFTTEETHGRVLRPGNRLIAHSPDVVWRSLYAAIIEEAPFSATEPAVGHPSFIYHLSRPTEVMRRIDGAPQDKALVMPRQLCITPGGTVAQWRHSGRPEILQVYLRQSLYETAVSEIHGCDTRSAEIVPCFATMDPLLEQLAIAIANALRGGTTQDGLYVDTMAQMMAVHLAQSHCSRSRPTRITTPGRLSGTRIRRLIEFIEEHLADDVSLEAIAAEGGISPIYLARAFKAAVGQSPHQYVLGRRIERAKKLLRDSDLPIVEVALAAGFSSQSHLSNWFVRSVGVSPAAYRRQGLH
jgi:AraC family transcriptional regulator